MPSLASAASFLVGVSLLIRCSGIRVDNALLAHERQQAFIGWQEHHVDGETLIIIATSYGEIKIRPNQQTAPKTVQLVSQLAAQRHCASCNFYRHEPVPESWGHNGFFGPPYALLQGSLGDLAAVPPPEEKPLVKKGDVCIIPNTKEFFIATAGHEEWGNSHVVWGQVVGRESWHAIHAVPTEPFTSRTDSGNITTRWLTPNATIPFTLRVEHAHEHPGGQHKRDDADAKAAASQS